MTDQRLAWLDIGRVIAAAAVALYHYAFLAPLTGAVTHEYGALSLVAAYGYLGVDLFFIISGFVILSSARRADAAGFAAARWRRLYPAFVACMTLTAVALAIFAADPQTLLRWLGNLTMLPGRLGVAPVDGVYWTLEYELIFYAAMFIVLATGAMARIEPIIAGWIALIALATMAGVKTVLLGGYFALFAAGTVLALVREDGLTARRAAMLAVAVACSAVNAADVAARLAANGRPVEPVAAAIAVAIMAALFLVMPRTSAPSRGVLLAGALTYPVYLVHNSVGLLVLPRVADRWAALLAAGVLTIGIAWAVHVLVERRGARIWRAVSSRAIEQPLRRLAQVRRHGSATG